MMTFIRRCRVPGEWYKKTRAGGWMYSMNYFFKTRLSSTKLAATRSSSKYLWYLFFYQTLNESCVSSVVVGGDIQPTQEIWQQNEHGYETRYTGQKKMLSCHSGIFHSEVNRIERCYNNCCFLERIRQHRGTIDKSRIAEGEHGGRRKTCCYSANMSLPRKKTYWTARSWIMTNTAGEIAKPQMK